jgi:predicted RNase H-like HicB family nuclease
MLFERVTGPFSGYFIAAYAGEMGDLGEKFLGFYRICRYESADYWESEPLFEGCCEQPAESGEDALQAAESAARRLIDGLPPIAAVSG